MLLYNANVITLESRQPKTELIAIQGNKILGTANSKDLDLFKGVGTKAINCKGGTIIPGFNDAHCHPLAFAASLVAIDCSPSSVKSIAELQAKIGQRVQQTPEGTWIRGTGYNEFYLAEKRHPTRWDLDKAAPYHPIKLLHRSRHACVVNSLALQLVGISGESPDPLGGIIDRELRTGEPTGLLLEMESYLEQAIPPLSPRELDEGMKIANEQYLSWGITSLQDATWSDTAHRWQTFQQLKNQGKLKSRVSLMMGIEDWQEIQETPKDRLEEQLCLGGAKIVLDQTTGSLHPPLEELKERVLQAHRAGLQLAFHAIEEDEIEAVATALGYALERIPKLDHRHRIEHCSVCPPSLMKRLKKLQVVIVTQPPFLYYSGERYVETVPPNKLRWLYPIGSFLKEGVKLAAGSDSPVVPCNPLVGVYAAVTRKAETGQIVLPEQQIYAHQALEKYTRGAAYASFKEKQRGTIAPGKLADLVLLSSDPTQVAAEEIKDIQVLMTIIDGEVVWESH